MKKCSDGKARAMLFDGTLPEGESNLAFNAKVNLIVESLARDKADAFVTVQEETIHGQCLAALGIAL